VVQDKEVEVTLRHLIAPQDIPHTPADHKDIPVEKPDKEILVKKEDVERVHHGSVLG
jgi:hypothetical protein